MHVNIFSIVVVQTLGHLQLFLTKCNRVQICAAASETGIEQLLYKINFNMPTVHAKWCSMIVYTNRAFKKSTFRLNVFICIGIFLGFFGDFIIALSVYFFLENITVMEVAVNVSSVTGHLPLMNYVDHISESYNDSSSMCVPSFSSLLPPPPPPFSLQKVANWLYHISFVLAFSSLFVKTWRIYRIFCNAELRKRVSNMHA